MNRTALIVLAAAVSGAALLVWWNEDLAAKLLFAQTTAVRVLLFVVALGLLATGHHTPAAGILFVGTLWFLVNRPDQEVRA